MAENNQGDNEKKEEQKKSKLENKLGPKKVWNLFFIVLLVVSIIIGVIVYLFTKGFNWTLLAFIVNFTLGTAVSIVFGWSHVHERSEWIIEFFGKYMTKWMPGLHIRFPYLGFMTVKRNVIMSQQMMLLFMNEAEKAGYGFGHVDFIDGSAPVLATVYFTIVDSYKATYNIVDVIKGIEEKLDGAIRTYLGNYTIDDANRLKVQFNIHRVLNGEVVAIKDGKLLDVKRKKEEAFLYKEILNKWGTKIDSIVVSDIVLSEKQKDIRRKLQDAAKQVEVAIEERKKKIIDASAHEKSTIIKARGEKKALALSGQGIADQVEFLDDKGVDPDKAILYLAERKKWEREGDTVIIDSSGTGVAGLGAQFAAGAKALDSSDDVLSKKKNSDKLNTSLTDKKKERKGEDKGANL